MATANESKSTSVDLPVWNFEYPGDGWNADDMIDGAEIRDPDGEVIGNLEDVITGPDGSIKNS